MINFPGLISGSQQLQANAAGLIRRLQTTVEHIRVTNTEAATDMVRGNVVHLTAGNRQALLAIANDLNKSEWVGVCCEGIEPEATGIIRTNGKAYVLFEEGLDPAPAASDRVFLSPTVEGRVTNVIPNTPGQYVVQVGIVLDSSKYVTDDSAEIQLQRCCNNYSLPQ